MAKKKSSDAPKPSAPKPPKDLAATVKSAEAIEAVIEAVTEAVIEYEAVKPEPVKRYEAPAPGGLVKVRNVSRATYDGIAPGAVREVPADHPGLHPLALELELVKG